MIAKRIHTKDPQRALYGIRGNRNNFLNDLKNKHTFAL